MSAARRSHQGLEMGQVARRSDGLDHLAMGIVLRPVHRDETGLQREVRVGVAHHDAARRREDLGVLLHVDDVTVPVIDQKGPKSLAAQ
jgi:hypothetical protein